MAYPAFFDQAPRIATHDPLAHLLGAAPGGLLEYRYLDAVRLAGHSCPTVAGAYLMAAKGLAALFPDRLPERGAIRVALRHAQAEGTTGVTASVLGLITGAAGEGGFKGLAGRFNRSGLLHFGAAIDGEVRLSTADRAVEVSYVPAAVPADPNARARMEAALRPDASEADRRAFADGFQERVRKILLDHRDDPALVVIRHLPPA